MSRTPVIHPLSAILVNPGSDLASKTFGTYVIMSLSGVGESLLPWPGAMFTAHSGNLTE
jgi:hypothetical protein